MKLIVVTIETRCYWPLQTCYDMVTTNPATTNAPQPGHYNLAITRPLRICYNNGHYKLLQPDHYKLATTPSLQPHYELATTLSLQPGHYHHLATTILPQPGHYNLATTQPLCYNLATTNLLQHGHYSPATTLTTNSLLKENHPEYTMLTLCLGFTSLLSANHVNQMSILCIHSKWQLLPATILARNVLRRSRDCYP